MLVCCFPLCKRHVACRMTLHMEGFPGQTHGGTEVLGALFCVSVLRPFIFWWSRVFSPRTEMSVAWTKLPSPPDWKNDAFASSCSLPLVWGTESRVTSHKRFADAKAQCWQHWRGHVGFLVVDYWSVPLLLTPYLSLGYCCVTWLVYAYCHRSNNQKQEGGQMIAF